MKDNIILSSGNIEVYQSDIDLLCDEYVQGLPDESMIFKSTVFSGMLNYIHRIKLKHIISQCKTDKGINKYNHDYALLDDIFQNVYIYLCTRYNITPSIIQFCVLTGISRETISDINQGKYRADGSRVKPETYHTVKNWYNTCESMLLSKAANESSIGSIFALKANYGYRDNVQQVEVITQDQQQATPEQIAQKYADIEKPRLIDAESESV